MGRRCRDSGLREHETVGASDALQALKYAVGSAPVCPLIRCDTDDGGVVQASDALQILQFSVGQPISLVCPAVEP